MARTGYPNNNQVEAAEQQMARGYTNAATSQPYANLVPPGTETDGRYTNDLVNWNELAPANLGGFNFDVGFADAEIPGLPAADQNWVVAEAIAYLDLKAGVYQFGVNCDDEFKLSTSPTPRSPSGLQLGLRSPGGGVADVFANFVVTQDGIYPIRLLWWEGTGGAGIEFFVVEQNYGSRRLINDRNTYFPVKAYRVATAAPQPVFAPPSLSGNALTISWTGSGTLQEASNLTGSPSDWSNVNPQPTGNTLTVTISSSPQRFYRIRQ